MSDLDAFILIGGRSTRMGRDKAGVPFRGEPMAERIATTIREALPQISVRFVASGLEQLLVHGGFARTEKFIFDIYPDRGPAGGLYTALVNSEKEWIFVSACDLPLISADLIKYLSDHVEPDNDAIVPVQSDGLPQPLAAFYRVRTVREEIIQTFERPRPTPSLRSILERLRTRYVPFKEIEHLPDSAAFFTNVNSAKEIE